jgi:hypothetical protein
MQVMTASPAQSWPRRVVTASAAQIWPRASQNSVSRSRVASSEPEQRLPSEVGLERVMTASPA